MTEPINVCWFWINRVANYFCSKVRLQTLQLHSANCPNQTMKLKQSNSAPTVFLRLLSNVLLLTWRCNQEQVTAITFLAFDMLLDCLWNTVLAWTCKMSVYVCGDLHMHTSKNPCSGVLPLGGSILWLNARHQAFPVSEQQIWPHPTPNRCSAEI